MHKSSKKNPKIFYNPISDITHFYGHTCGKTTCSWAFSPVRRRRGRERGAIKEGKKRGLAFGFEYQFVYVSSFSLPVGGSVMAFYGCWRIHSCIRASTMHFILASSESSLKNAFCFFSLLFFIF